MAIRIIFEVPSTGLCCRALYQAGSSLFAIFGWISSYFLHEGNFTKSDYKY